MSKKQIKLSLITAVMGSAILGTTLTPPILSNQNSNIIAKNINFNTTTSNVQTVTSVADIKYQYSATSVSSFAIVKDAIEGDRLYGWGRNDFGQLGIGNTIDQSLPQLCKFADGPEKLIITSVHAGGGHTLVILENNQYYLTGANNVGQQGNGGIGGGNVLVFTKNSTLSDKGSIDLDDKGQPKIVAGNGLTAGEGHTMAVINNEIWSWGNNSQGQQGNGNTNHVPTPTKVEGLPSGSVINSVQCGLENSYVWIGNEIWSWGLGESSGIAGAPKNVTTPTKVEFPRVGNITSFSSTFDHCISVLDSKYIFGWGGNEVGNLGLGEGAGRPQTPEPLTINDMNANSVIDSTFTYDEGSGIIIGTKEDNKITQKKLYMTGGNLGGELCDGSADDKYIFQPIINYTVNDSTVYQSFQGGVFTTTDGVTHAWGNNQYGTFGIGTNNMTNPSPVLIDTFSTPTINGSNEQNNKITATDALNDFWNGTTLNQLNLEKYLNINLPTADTKFTITPNTAPFADDTKQTITLSLTASTMYHASPDGQKTTADTPIEEIIITKFKDPNAIIPEPEPTPTPETTSTSQFPWWWILVTIGGVTIISLLTWWIIKKQKNKEMII